MSRSRSTPLAAVVMLALACGAPRSPTRTGATHVEPITGFADFVGHRVAYEVSGAGEAALVFVHGGSSERGVWHHQLEGLLGDPRVAGRRLVAVDLIGHGASDAPPIAYSMDDLAGSVAAVLDELHLQRAILVGHSNGVPVVRQFLRLFPARVDALVLVDGALRATLSPAMVQWMRAALERPDYEQFQQQMVASLPVGELSPDDVQRIKAAQLATPKHVLAGSLESLLAPDLWAEDPIDVSLLVVLAASQPNANDAHEHLELLQRLSPTVEIQVWPDVTHFLMLERSAAFNRLLADFVAGVDAPTDAATDAP